MAEGQGSSNLKWDLLVADTWDDADLKKRLLSDPASVFKERGISPPTDIELKIVEDTDDTKHLILPTAPSEAELSAEELESVAGGGGGGFCLSLCGGHGCGGHGCGGHGCGGHGCGGHGGGGHGCGGHGCGGHFCH